MASRTPPGVRELKLNDTENIKRRYSRTPPGVRELKPQIRVRMKTARSRTPPGVRELKPHSSSKILSPEPVAPLPGCVN